MIILIGVVFDGVCDYLCVVFVVVGGCVDVYCIVLKLGKLVFFGGFGIVFYIGLLGNLLVVFVGFEFFVKV